MSSEIYTVSLETETVERLKTVADHQGLTMGAVLQQAVVDYLESWECHITDLSDDEREALPWLAGHGNDA